MEGSWKSIFLDSQRNHYEYVIQRFESEAVDEFAGSLTSNVITAWQWALSRHLAREAAKCANLFWDFLKENGFWDELIFLGIETSSLLDNDSSEKPYVLDQIATLLMVRGKWKEAETHLLAAKGLTDRAQDGVLAYRVRKSLGDLMRRQGKWPEALECYEICYELSMRSGARVAQAESLIGLGVVNRLASKPDEALGNFRRAEAILADHPQSNDAMAHLYNSLGNLYLEQKRFADALECYSKALIIRQQDGNEYRIGICYNNMAGACFGLGDSTRAFSYWSESERIYSSLDAAEALVVTWRAKGMAYARLGKFEMAEEYLDKAIVLAEQEGSPHHVTKSRYALGRLLYETGQYSKALEILEKAELQANFAMNAQISELREGCLRRL